MTVTQWAAVVITGIFSGVCAVGLYYLIESFWKD